MGETRLASTEEVDNLNRSVKKPKGLGIQDDVMDDHMHGEDPCILEGLKGGIAGSISNPLFQAADPVPGESGGKNNGQRRKVVSYKDKLIRLNGAAEMSDSDDEGWMEIQRREEEEEDLLEEEDDALDDPLCPSLKFSKSQHREDCKQWRKALIIKLLGKRMGARFLMARLVRLWNLVGVFEVIDMENGYIVIRFQEDGDYNRVLHEGPWIVADHYLTVQRWRPLFNPYEDHLKRVAVWIRVPGLPLEFYTNHWLWTIGSFFGRPLKIDKNSLRRSEIGDGQITERGRFARICVEVDLRRSFLSKFKIGERVMQVGYEGLHMICFACGMYGHRKDLCPSSVGSKYAHAVGVTEEGNQKGVELEEAVVQKKEEEAFGNWMVVQKPGRGRKMRVSPAKQMVQKESGIKSVEEPGTTNIDLSGVGVIISSDCQMEDVVPKGVSKPVEKEAGVVNRTHDGGEIGKRTMDISVSLSNDGVDKQKSGDGKASVPKAKGTEGSGMQKNRLNPKGVMNRGAGSENLPPNTAMVGFHKGGTKGRGPDSGVLQPVNEVLMHAIQALQPTGKCKGEGTGSMGKSNIGLDKGIIALNGTRNLKNH